MNIKLREVKDALREFERKAKELKELEKELKSFDAECFGSEIERVKRMKYIEENKIELERIPDMRSALEELKRKIKERETTPLSISISKEHESIESGKKSKIVVNIAYKDSQMSDAEVVLSPKSGKLSPERGKTDKEGVFVSEYTAPTVTSEEKEGVTVSVSKNCYKGAESSSIITILPLPPPLPPLVVERTIYDPAERNFVISKEHAWLPNVERWITEQDPFAYWLVLCITNNTDFLKEIKKVEIEIDPSLKIKDFEVEGYAQKLTPIESAGKDIIKHSCVIPRGRPLVIPREGGSSRLYVKFDSDVCNQRYKVRGKVVVDETEAEIRPKPFLFSCARGKSIEDAILKSPETALRYEENQMKRDYSSDEVQAILRGLGIVTMDILGMCKAPPYPKHEDIEDKVNSLKKYMELVKDRLGRFYEDFENMVKKMEVVLFKGEAVPEVYAEEIRRICLDFHENLVVKLLEQSIKRSG